MVGTKVKIGILGLIALIGIMVSIPTGLTSLGITAVAVGVIIVVLIGSMVR